MTWLIACKFGERRASNSGV